MPHLDYNTFPGQIFWLFISFAALYFIVSKIIFPRVETVLANRDDHIAGNLDKAENFRRSAEEAEQKLAVLLQQAAEEARKALAKSVEAAAEKAEARKAELSAKLNKKIRESEMKIGQINAQSDSILESVSAQVSQSIVKRILEAA